MIARSLCLANRFNLIGHSMNKLNSITTHSSLTRYLNKANLHSAVPTPGSTVHASRQLACGGILSTSRFIHSKNPSGTKDGQPKINLTATPKSSILGDDLKNIIESQVVKESDQTPKKSAPAAEPETPAGGDQPKSRFERIFSKEHAWKYSLGFITALIGGAVVYVLVDWGAPLLDENKRPMRDEFSDMPIVIQYPRRAFHAAMNYYEMMKEPSTEKLLPEPIQPPYYQPPYTLVIEMSGILLHPEWTFSHGWRYKKRPGLDYFIEQVKYPLFEVVLFTREPFLSGAPIVSSLDPQNQIAFKLFRESTKFVNNKYVKDLSFMNRDLSKIIVIDWDENAYSMQPRNALHRLKKWEGDETDTDLVYLASFLKLIAASGVSDVREVLDYYNKELVPLDTFKLNQVKLHESEEQRQREMEELKQKQKKSFSLFRR